MNNLDFSRIIDATGWTLLHSLWQITILGCVIWMILQFIDKDNAHLRYAISVISLGLILIASLFTFFIYISRGSNPSDNIISSNVLYKFFNTKETFSETLTWSGLKIEHYFPYLVKFWFLGISILSLHMLWNYIYSIKLKRYLTYPLNQKTQKLALNLMSKIGLKHNIVFKESGFVQVPSLIGYFKPVVLIPISMISGIPENQIEMIIAHELAHVRRHDYLFQFIQSILEMLFFYHPIIWWLSSVVNTEREHLCDDLAVSVCGESLTLIKALNNMEAIRKKQPELVLGFSGKKNTILNRAHRIIRPKPNSNPKLEKVLLSSVFLFLFAGLFLFSNYAISENSIFAKQYNSKINIVDSKSAPLIGTSVSKLEQTSTLSDFIINQKKEKSTKMDSTKINSKLNSNKSKSGIEKTEMVTMPPLPPFPGQPTIAPVVTPAPLPFMDFLKSGDLTTQKTLEMIREQMIVLQSSKLKLDTLDLHMNFEEIRKELQEELKSLDINQETFQRDIKEQQEELEHQLKELSESNWISDLQLEQKEQKEEFARYLEEIENSKNLSAAEKEMMKQNIQESIQKISTPEFQENIKRQLEKAKLNLQEQLKKMKSADWEVKLKNQRKSLKEALERLESPEYQQNLKEQIEKSQRHLQKHIERLNSPEYRKQLKENIEHPDKDSIPESTESLLQDLKKFGDASKKPLILVDGKRIKLEKLNDLKPEEIDHINVYKGAQAIRRHGNKAKHGVIEITSREKTFRADTVTKLKLGSGKDRPIFIVDGKIISKSEIEKINPNQIKSINVIKGKEAINQFGEKAKYGAVIIDL
ncbi:M56 family metallopeptidase [Ancylomarina longa]|uniref:Peptidase M56 domain-containing protein n=1 Tax=Ancylomarina longa TaxID=2487017 RepID=A0A434AF68_9BACT|nr:M56 family metallopeptidase [Ancylomarina longa]RUT73023.1 hypothetical protein DLK05_15480 [Ancylomarina longa]